MKHEDIQPSYIHTPFNWLFADQTARLAATGFASGDMYKAALQESDKTVWVLLSTAPVWSPIAASVSSSAVIGEDLAGTKDGTNTTFTFVNAPISNTDAVYFNGVRQLRGTDYTIASATLTALTFAPASGDSLIADYVH